MQFSDGIGYAQGENAALMCRLEAMKLLLVSSARIIGGAERVTLQLAQMLLERGHPVEAICPHGGPWRGALVKAGIRTYPRMIGGAVNLFAPLAIARTVAISRPDLLMVTTSDQWVWSSLTPRSARMPRLVLVRHMGLPLSYRLRWLVGRRADAIVAVSDSVRETLLEDYAIPAGKVHTIVNATRFPVRQTIPNVAERMRARSALGLPAAGRWVGFLGGINLEKGIEDAMVAVRRTNQPLDDVKLLVCGRKNTRHKTPDGDDLARRHGLQSQVHFLGHLDDVIPAIIASDAIIIATRSKLREGLAQTAIDAMACGTPIVAYALGGVTDVVGKGEPAAILARPDDVDQLSFALTRLLEDSKLAGEIAARGLDRARRQFDPALMADRYERLFERLLAHD
jgi:glycosyltransferase involved in cell wall biosynthesis